jgi:hypothetical protein
MALSKARLESYLALERVMLQLDDAGDPTADHIRDAMDPLWHDLTEDERAEVNARGFIAAGEAVMKMPLGEGLFSATVEPIAVEETLRTEPLVVFGWELAA